MFNTDFYPKTTGRLLGLLLMLLISGLPVSPLVAQITQDFSNSLPGANHYVDPLSPFSPHILPSTMLPQTQPSVMTVEMVPGYQASYTPTRDRDASGGLTDGELFGVVDFTVPNSTENDMGSLTIDFVANPPPSGNNSIYVFEDPDGLVTLRFNPVVVDGSTNFSMSYIVANTSFENSNGGDDRIAIYLENLDSGMRTMLVDAANDAILNDETWRELTADLSAQSGTTVQLVVEFDTNSSSEEMAIDNIVFSSGTLAAGWPVCVEPVVTALAQSPSTVCPGVPFRLILTGDLGNATEWAIYSDAAGTEEVGRTSSDTYDFFSGATPGTTYYVRGEGGCTGSADLFPLTMSIVDGDCEPNNPPSTSFEEPLGATEEYVDTGNPNFFRQLTNNQGQPTVAYTSKAKELGFGMFYTVSRNGTDGPIGSTDGDAVGVSSDPDFNFPDGQQGMVLEDTDGITGVYFSSVDITGLTGVTVSFDYYLNPTSYESSGIEGDGITVGLASPGLTILETFISSSADGSGGIPGFVTGEWRTLTFTIMGNYQNPIQFYIEADFDATSERLLIDNVSFSAGMVVCEDTDAPLVSCPEPISVDAGEDCMATVDYAAATAVDDCSENVIIAYSQESGTAFPVGSNTVTVTASDESGKSSTCTFTVTVNDVTPPAINFTDIEVKLDPSISCDYILVGDTFDPIATDNCGDVTLVNDNGLSSLAGDTLFVGTTSITWTATDAAGRESTITQGVNLIVPPGCFATGVTRQDVSDFSGVIATPNPFRESTVVAFSLPFTAEVDIEVLDVSGRVLRSAKILPGSNRSYSWEWMAGEAPAGVYFLRLRARNQLYTQRVVLMR